MSLSFVITWFIINILFPDLSLTYVDEHKSLLSLVLACQFETTRIFFIRQNKCVLFNAASLISVSDSLTAMLSPHLDEPRAYIGCMKSGEVFSDSWVHLILSHQSVCLSWAGHSALNFHSSVPFISFHLISSENTNGTNLTGGNLATESREYIPNFLRKLFHHMPAQEQLDGFLNPIYLCQLFISCWSSFFFRDFAPLLLPASSTRAWWDCTEIVQFINDHL